MADEAVRTVQNPYWPKESLGDVLVPALAEFIAMTIFVFVGVGTAMNSTTPLDVRIPLAFGLAIFVLAYSGECSLA